MKKYNVVVFFSCLIMIGVGVNSSLYSMRDSMQEKEKEPKDPIGTASGSSSSSSTGSKTLQNTDVLERLREVHEFILACEPSIGQCSHHPSSILRYVSVGRSSGGRHTTKTYMQELLYPVPEHDVVTCRIRDVEDECLNRCCNFLLCSHASPSYGSTLLQNAFFMQMISSDREHLDYFVDLLSVLIKQPFDLNETFLAPGCSGLCLCSRSLRLSILHAAVMLGDHRVLGLVLAEKSRINLNILDSKGLTPLHRAMAMNWPWAVKQLIEAGANTDITFTTGRGCFRKYLSALEYASKIDSDNKNCEHAKMASLFQLQKCD